MAADLHRHPEILNVSDSTLFHNFMESNLSLANTSTLLQQLDTIDNAACGWIQFMSKVGLAGPPLRPKGEGSSWAPPGSRENGEISGVGKSRKESQKKAWQDFLKNTLKI